MPLLTLSSNNLPWKRFSDLGIDFDPVYILGNYGSDEFTFIITDFVNTFLEFNFGINLTYNTPMISLNASYIFDLIPTFILDFYMDQTYDHSPKTITSTPTFSEVTEGTIDRESGECDSTSPRSDNTTLLILLLYLLGITTLVAIEGLKTKDTSNLNETLTARRTAQANRVRRMRFGLNSLNPQEGSTETEYLSGEDRLVTQPNPQGD